MPGIERQGGGTISDPQALDRALPVAVRAAREAGQILCRHFRNVSAREKGPGDLVTEADLASQRRIAEILLDGLDDSTLLAEEEGVRPDPARSWCWIVDPLDGTVNFAHGLTPWCTSIGLSYRGMLVLGVIYVPLGDVIFTAVRGQGAFENGQPIRVSPANRLRDSLIATGFPANPEDLPDQLQWFGRFSTGTHSVRRTGSTAWNLAMVARGGFEAMYASSVSPWDVAAGIVLVEEAGGHVSDLSGHPHDLARPPILATNGHVHQETVEVLQGRPLRS